MTLDCQYEIKPDSQGELGHEYGSQFHILSNPYLLSLLADLCCNDTQQPKINELITRIYRGLLPIVVNQEFPFHKKEIPTRMVESHPEEGIYRGSVLDRNQKVVSVNLARAGTVPSQVVYSELNYLMDPALIRQDHIGISRQTDQKSRVIGSEISGHKIGGPIDSSIILFPDPMGATGGTLVKACQLYKDFGQPKKTIAIHCIITPEYIKKVKEHTPHLIVYTARLDRGLSKPEILKTKPGSRIDQEKGLNEKDYIVPGGGGFGEILNNAFV